MSRVIAVTLALSAAAWAQEEEVNMNMQVGGSVQSDTGSVQMQMNVPMPSVQMNVKVKQRTTTTTTTVTSTDDDDAPAPATTTTASARGRAMAVPRDCGTGNDPGCAMARSGQYAMDAETFRGFLEALRADANEISRKEMCETTFENHFLTAAQLGLVLDLFQNEILRLDVAKAAAPKVVNPSHALGHAKKWRNSISGKEYTQLMAAQR